MSTKRTNSPSETVPNGAQRGDGHGFAGNGSGTQTVSALQNAEDSAEDTIVKTPGSTPKAPPLAPAIDSADLDEDTIVQLRIPAEPSDSKPEGSDRKTKEAQTNEGGKSGQASVKPKNSTTKKSGNKSAAGKGTAGRRKPSGRKGASAAADKSGKKPGGRSAAKSKRPKRKSRKDPDNEDTVVQPGEARRWVVAPQETPSKRFPDGWEYLPPDTVIKDRFVVLEMVGQGGMGQVYKALDLRREEIGVADPHVALKVLKPKLSEDTSAISAFKREAATAQSLSSPRVVEIIDYDQDDELHFIVSEFLYGESLFALLKRLDGKPLNFDRALVVVRDLAEALRYAHGKGVIHADFKPGNAFVCEDGHLKLLDFGVARTFGSASTMSRSDRRDDGDLQGITPAYASCEVLDGKPPDPRDDIFSLAVVAYRLLSGRHPFNGRNALEAKEEGLRPARIKRLRPSAWWTLRRALAFNRSGRVPTMLAFIEGFTADSFGANFQAWLGNIFRR